MSGKGHAQQPPTLADEGTGLQKRPELLRTPHHWSRPSILRVRAAGLPHRGPPGAAPPPSRTHQGDASHVPAPPCLSSWRRPNRWRAPPPGGSCRTVEEEILGSLAKIIRASSGIFPSDSGKAGSLEFRRSRAPMREMLKSQPRIRLCGSLGATESGGSGAGHTGAGPPL